MTRKEIKWAEENKKGIFLTAFDGQVKIKVGRQGNIYCTQGPREEIPDPGLDPGWSQLKVKSFAEVLG